MTTPAHWTVLFPKISFQQPHLTLSVCYLLNTGLEIDDPVLHNNDDRENVDTDDTNSDSDEYFTDNDEYSMDDDDKDSTVKDPKPEKDAPSIIYAIVAEEEEADEYLTGAYSFLRKKYKVQVIIMIPGIQDLIIGTVHGTMHCRKSNPIEIGFPS